MKQRISLNANRCVLGIISLLPCLSGFSLNISRGVYYYHMYGIVQAFLFKTIIPPASLLPVSDDAKLRFYSNHFVTPKTSFGSKTATIFLVEAIFCLIQFEKARDEATCCSPPRDIIEEKLPMAFPVYLKWNDVVSRNKKFWDVSASAPRKYTRFLWPMNRS